MDARETLRALDEDVARLLQAGGTIAATDDGLNARRDALAALGAKVPVLAKVAEQVGKVTSAKGRAATTELLSLGAMVWQLRAAQAQAARADGAVSDVPATERLGTPLAPHEIEPLYESLSHTGSGRRERVKDVLDRGAGRDLRMLGPWVAALADRDAEIADAAAERGVPSFGRAASPALNAALDLTRGNAADARRLTALAQIEGTAARPLLEKALAAGSIAVRAAAMRALGRVDAAAAAPLAARAIRERAPVDVRVAAVQSLANVPTDEAVDALFVALSDDEALQHHAAAALATSTHSDIARRLLAMMTPEAMDVRDYVAPKPSKAAAVTPAQQKAAQKAEREAHAAAAQKRVHALSVLAAIGTRKDAALEARLIELWTDGVNPAVAACAGGVLTQMGSPKALATLLESLKPGRKINGAQFNVAAMAAMQQPPARAYELLSPFLAPDAPAYDNSAGNVMHLIASSPDTRELDPRWTDAVFAAMKGSRSGFGYIALRRIATARDLDRIVLMLEHKDTLPQAIQLLGNLKDKRAVAPLLALIDRKGFDEWSRLAEALNELDDPSAVEPLRALVERLSKPAKKGSPAFGNSWMVRRIEAVAQHLARDRTVG